MKKNILISIASLILVIACLVLFVSNEQSNLKLTHEEKDFINQNKDSTFYIGYYNTPLEKLVINRLCTKLSKDTGLNIYPYEEDWNINISLLRSGDLPMLANMNITDNRLEYTNFTNNMENLPIGIYSRYNYKIESYEDLEGKTIGVERNVYLLNELRLRYPEIMFTTEYYDSLKELKVALYYGEIDGFLSSYSYSEDLKLFNFFGLNGLSQRNNHIGVSKKYPLLYSIINKEIDYLIKTGWDKKIRDVVRFDLEIKQINLTDDEKVHIERNNIITVGIPSDYKYYAYGDTKSPEGIIPAFLKKINFLTNIDFVYVFDSYDNLFTRDDIEIIISSQNLNYPSTVPIFSDNLIAISNKGNSIRELYQLEPYKIGIINDTILVDKLKILMPYLEINIFETYKGLYESLENKKIDYGIIPKKLFEKKQSNLINNGMVKERFHYIYSLHDDKALINIMNKCLTTMDTNTIVDKELVNLINDEERTDNSIIIALGIMVGFLIFLMIFALIKKIIKLKEKWNYLLYVDSDTMLYNELWLKKRLKIEYINYNYYLVEPCNLDSILERYGENAYKKAIKDIVVTLKEHLKTGEYIIKMKNNQFMLIKEKMTDSERILYLNQLKNLFKKSFLIFDINYTYQMHVVSLKPEEKYLNYDNLIKELEIGLRYAKYTGNVVDYNYEIYSKYKSKIDFDTKISSAIMNEEVLFKLDKIFDDKDQLYGYNVSYYCVLEEYGEISYNNLKNSVKRLGLQLIFDKIIFKKLFDYLSNGSNTDKKFVIDAHGETINNINFFEWVNEKTKLINDIQLYIKIDIDSYENQLENPRIIDNSNINFIISSFENNLVANTIIKDYDISTVEMSANLLYDMEQNKELIEFIGSFCQKYKKKILFANIITKNQLNAIKQCDIENYLYIFRSNENESIDS